MNRTNQSIVSSGSSQGEVFDNAGIAEEACHDSFGTKTMVISPSVEDVGEVMHQHYNMELCIAQG